MDTYEIVDILIRSSYQTFFRVPTHLDHAVKDQLDSRSCSVGGSKGGNQEV